MKGAFYFLEILQEDIHCFDTEYPNILFKILICYLNSPNFLNLFWRLAIVFTKNSNSTVNVHATHLISRNLLFQPKKWKETLNSRNFLLDKNFVKATFSLKKLLNSRFHEIFLWWENFCFFQTVHMMLLWFFHRLNVFNDVMNLRSF